MLGLVKSDIDPWSQQPEHDDKDWTWVLERRCPECDFDAAGYEPSAVGADIRRNAAAWADVLDGDVEQLRHRRRPDRWSDLEYAAHVRDVYGLYHERLRMMLDSDDPLYPNWDQNETAIAEAYNEQSPTDVRRDLLSAADVLADAFDRLEADQWTRVGRRSDGASFTVDSFARYLIHDPVHHLWDVRSAT
jgi:DinB superfamily